MNLGSISMGGYIDDEMLDLLNIDSGSEFITSVSLIGHRGD